MLCWMTWDKFSSNVDGDLTHVIAALVVVTTVCLGGIGRLWYGCGGDHDQDGYEATAT